MSSAPSTGPSRGRTTTCPNRRRARPGTGPGSTPTLAGHAVPAWQPNGELGAEPEAAVVPAVELDRRDGQIRPLRDWLSMSRRAKDTSIAGGSGGVDGVCGSSLTGAAVWGTRLPPTSRAARSALGSATAPPIARFDAATETPREVQSSRHEPCPRAGCAPTSGLRDRFARRASLRSRLPDASQPLSCSGPLRDRPHLRL